MGKIIKFIGYTCFLMIFVGIVFKFIHIYKTLSTVLISVGAGIIVLIIILALNIDDYNVNDNSSKNKTSVHESQSGINYAVNPLSKIEPPSPVPFGSVKKDSFYYLILPIYKQVIGEYVKLFNDLPYVSYEIEEYEKVFIIDDSLIVFIALREAVHYRTAESKRSGYNFFNDDISMLYNITIEELTANNLFKFNATKFGKKFPVNSYYFFNIQRYYGQAREYGDYFATSGFRYIEKNLPYINLQERFDSSLGWLYHYIVIEISDGNTEYGYAIWYTNNPNYNKLAIAKCRYIYNKISNYENATNDKNKIHYQGIRIYGDIHHCIDNNILEKIESNKGNIDYPHLIKYYVIDKHIKEYSDIDKISIELLRKANDGEFNNIEKQEYHVDTNKWKSEYLVKELCEQIYGKNNVIYQYKPHYLLNNDRQMSYDIYLPKLKVAIEYQGKQHFEPVEYFGGKNSFVNQQERDQIKMKLSVENKISLVYINYWESITKELITQKVNDAVKLKNNIEVVEQ